MAAIPACEVADGFVFNATDCDDRNPDIFPGAKEICDGVDQDCDLTIDEADSLDEPGISKCTTMHRDVDEDGYGDNNIFECLCQQGSDPSVTHDNYTYVIYAGDCYDYNSAIKPLSCADEIDNDNDGFVDAQDSDCYNGYREGAEDLMDTVPLSELKETPYEYLDGHDNDCDGRVAAIELDCDDDGSFPMLPVEIGGSERITQFERASEVGLEACQGLEENLSCWGDSRRLECDKITAEVINGEIAYNGTGLWMLNISESADGFEGRYDGGYRKYASTPVCDSSMGDCDDQCSSRCPGQVETCDGLDNNCSGAEPGYDTYGIPNSLDPDVDVLGTIASVEMDMDGDGYLSCDSFSVSLTETQWTDSSCAQLVENTSVGNDCNNLCFYTSPGATERCDGFQGVCDGENLEGGDQDLDDHRTCGAWGTDEGSQLTEDIFAVVWLKNVNWMERGSEPVELQRPVAEADNSGLSPEERAANRVAEIQDMKEELDSADTGGQARSADDSAELFNDSGEANAEPDIILPDPEDLMRISNAGAGLLGGDVSVDQLDDMIPLIIPRKRAPDCDNRLKEQLTLLLGEVRMERVMNPLSNENPHEIILQACAHEAAAGCAVVKLSLSETTDEDTYLTQDLAVSDIPAFSDDCENSPEQWIARSVWQGERILETRETVVEYECLRMYGRSCKEISETEKLVDGWQFSMIDSTRWINADRIWWKEIGRFNPNAIVGGTMMSCWGNPTDPTTEISQETGGDCNDEEGASHRDNAEGPGDLVNLYLTGSMTDCSTCLDGIDNNCDGTIDCADPACAQCFVGQGVGCGGGTESPCAQAGCSSPSSNGAERLYRSLSAVILGLVAVFYRRRKRR